MECLLFNVLSMKKCIVFCVMLFSGFSIFAQNDIKIMSYNLLIYPEGAMVNRIDTLSDILDYCKPDLLLLQELRSEDGLRQIEGELDALFGNYKAGVYVPQISNPSNSWRLQQNMVYNESVFELVSEEVIETPYRDVNYFQLKILDGDSEEEEFLHAYVTHLKSSQGSTNEQLRLSMVEVLVDRIAELPEDSNVIVAGDFNVYYGGEPAYELLLKANGANTLFDPIDMPGWAGTNFPNLEIYSQSTRLSSLDDGSGGGMDDRFDFILLSESLMKTNSPYVYKENSYKALGNNGTCYNRDLIDCTTDDNVPIEILRSLYHMSDHLPIVLSLEKNQMVSTIELENNSLIELSPNPAIDQIVVLKDGDNPMVVRVFNLHGTLVLEQDLFDRETVVDLIDLTSGVYVLQSVDAMTGAQQTKKLVIQK